MRTTHGAAVVLLATTLVGCAGSCSGPDVAPTVEVDPIAPDEAPELVEAPVHAEDPPVVPEEEPGPAPPCAYSAVRREVRERVRNGDPAGALEVLLAYRAADDDPCGEDDDASRLIEHVRWLATLDEQLASLGARFLSRPRRVFRDPDVAARDAPGGALREGYGALEDDAVDVWAAVPNGALLVARPEDHPAHTIDGDRYALAGWLEPEEVRARPPASWVVDTGRPLLIWRGPPIETDDTVSTGAPCIEGDQPGLSFDLYGSDLYCAPLTEMCGAPGLTPPSYEPEEPTVGYCADCPARFRSYRRVGDYCRSTRVGSTWQCAPDGDHLVCTAPGQRPPPVPPDGTVAVPLDAWTRAHPISEELAAVETGLRGYDPYGGGTPELIQFHARSSPDLLLRLACAPDANRSDLIFRLLHQAGFFDRPIHEADLPCLRRFATRSPALRFALSELPDGRLRPELERLARRGFDSASATLVILDGQDIGDAVRGLAGVENPLNTLLRNYVRHADDPRLIVPALIELLERDDLIDGNRMRVRSALAGLTARLFRDAAEARAFWASHRSSTIDAWLAEASSDDDPDVRRRAYERLGERAPTETGRAALIAGLTDGEAQPRRTAAISLARWRDRRAAPVLAAFLPNFEAFLALGWLAPTTLGFADAESLADRRAAVARWREWAR